MLRKKPDGALLSKTAHQIEREYRMLNALHEHNTRGQGPHVPIPRPYVLCEDTTIIGTPFYIMEFVQGRIFSDVRFPGLSKHDRKEW